MSSDAVFIDQRDAGHIFRAAPGHIADTLENRRLLIETAGEENRLGSDRFGNLWYARILEDGRQVWVQVRGRRIRNGGVNAVPRTYHPVTGLIGKDETDGRQT